MSAADAPLTLTESAAIHWRLLRTGLAPGSGFQSAAEAATAGVGLQAQDLTSVLLGLRARLQSPPALMSDLKQAALDLPDDGSAPELVRFSAMRQTLHLFPTERWQGVARLLDDAVPDTRRQCSGRELEKCRRALVRAGRDGLVAADLASTSARFGLHRLNRSGEAAHLGRAGRGTLYVSHTAIVEQQQPGDAATEEGAAMAREYLHSYGPASEADLRRYFGVRAATSRAWLEEIRAETTAVECGGRRGLLALSADAGAMLALEGQRLPVVVLPMYDSFTMSLGDKSWLVWSPEAMPAIWGVAATVNAVVLVNGKAAATWSHSKDGQTLRRLSRS
eukprot:m51a1_g6425 hypothetical protein (335) ;mRNA; f:321163-322285